MNACKECKAYPRLDDVYCHKCGALLENPRIRKGRDRFFAAFFVTVAFPLFQLFIGIFASMANGGNVGKNTYVEILLGFALAFCFYLAFRGYNKAKPPIIIYAFIFGGLYIANASVILITHGLSLALTGWFLTGGLYLSGGWAMFKSRDVDSYILSKMT